MIEVKHLKKSFKQLAVLKDVNFNVKEGEVFALLGSNGAGKTTIIRILSTLLRADDGVMTVGRYDVTKEVLQVKQIISLTGQFSAVDEILSGKENLMLVAKLRHIKKPNEAVMHLLEQFHLVEAMNRKVATYSGGMKRRLDIAMSLLGNPKLIFLDEPTTGLDPEARIAVWNEVKKMTAKGTTVFLTTQYLEEAEQLADTIAILHEGEILIQGTLAMLKQHFPPAKVEYIEKQPSLEDIFLTLINEKKGDKENEEA